jgi:hypothetical protein
MRQCCSIEGAAMLELCRANRDKADFPGRSGVFKGFELFKSCQKGYSNRDSNRDEPERGFCSRCYKLRSADLVPE